MKKIVLIFTLALLPIIVFAGSTGYIFEGKTYYLFKNGETVNELPDLNRVPASVNNDERDNNSMVLYFTEDDIARCYYWAPKSKSKTHKDKKNIHCIKKESED